MKTNKQTKKQTYYATLIYRGPDVQSDELKDGFFNVGHNFMKLTGPGGEKFIGFYPEKKPLNNKGEFGTDKEKKKYEKLKELSIRDGKSYLIEKTIEISEDQYNKFQEYFKPYISGEKETRYYFVGNNCIDNMDKAWHEAGLPFTPKILFNPKELVWDHSSGTAGVKTWLSGDPTAGDLKKDTITISSEYSGKDIAAMYNLPPDAVKDLGLQDPLGKINPGSAVRNISIDLNKVPNIPKVVHTSITAKSISIDHNKISFNNDKEAYLSSINEDLASKFGAFNLNDESSAKDEEVGDSPDNILKKPATSNDNGLFKPSSTELNMRNPGYAKALNDFKISNSKDNHRAQYEEEKSEGRNIDGSEDSYGDKYEEEKSEGLNTASSKDNYRAQDEEEKSEGHNIDGSEDSYGDKYEEKKSEGYNTDSSEDNHRAQDEEEKVEDNSSNKSGSIFFDLLDGIFTPFRIVDKALDPVTAPVFNSGNKAIRGITSIGKNKRSDDNNSYGATPTFHASASSKDGFEVGGGVRFNFIAQMKYDNPILNLSTRQQAKLSGILNISSKEMFEKASILVAEGREAKSQEEIESVIERYFAKNQAEKAENSQNPSSFFEQNQVAQENLNNAAQDYVIKTIGDLFLPHEV
jgi:phage-related protein